MAEYSFVTKWFIRSDPRRVWDELNATERYHDWWPGFVEYHSLTPGITGVGARAERVVRGALPYRLRYTTTTTHYDPPREVAYDSEGDLMGRGRFRVDERDGGTQVTFYWDVRTTGAVLNLLAPVLRPLFAWNHNRVMAQGERALSKRLDGK